MAIEHQSESALARAVRKAGSQSAFGKLIGKSQSLIHDWLRAGRIPAEHVLAVEAATGISRHDLRPDIYPIESGADGAGSSSAPVDPGAGDALLASLPVKAA